MRKSCVLAMAVAMGCTDDDPVSFGQVKAIDRGTGTVEMTACLDAGLLSCDGQPTELTATHGDASTPMRFSGLLFAQHVGTLDLGDREAPFVVSDGSARVVMHLPQPFEVAATPETPIGPEDQLALRWEAAGAPMVWAVSYSCPSKTGGTLGDSIDDDGTLDLSGKRIADAIGPEAAQCEIDLEISRVAEGTVDTGFRAERGTGIARRSVRVQLAP